MKNRKPFQLKNTLIIYNVSQVVFSIILVIEVSARYAFISEIVMVDISEGKVLLITYCAYMLRCTLDIQTIK